MRQRELREAVSLARWAVHIWARTHRRDLLLTPVRKGSGRTAQAETQSEEYVTPLDWQRELAGWRTAYQGTVRQAANKQFDRTAAVLAGTDETLRRVLVAELQSAYESGRAYHAEEFLAEQEWFDRLLRSETA